MGVREGQGMALNPLPLAQLCRGLGGRISVTSFVVREQILSMFTRCTYHECDDPGDSDFWTRRAIVHCLRCSAYPLGTCPACRRPTALPRLAEFARCLPLGATAGAERPHRSCAPFLNACCLCAHHICLTSSQTIYAP